MSFAHDEEKGAMGRSGRHGSVSVYANNLGSQGYDTSRRRSSIVPAGAALGSKQDEGILNQRDDTFRKMSVAVPNLAELSADAKAASDLEHKMGFREGVRLYPKAIMFSWALSLAVIVSLLLLSGCRWIRGPFPPKDCPADCPVSLLHTNSVLTRRN